MIPTMVRILESEEAIRARMDGAIVPGGMDSRRKCIVCESPFRLALVVCEFAGEFQGKFVWACFGEHAEAIAAAGACSDFEDV